MATVRIQDDMLHIELKGAEVLWAVRKEGLCPYTPIEDDAVPIPDLYYVSGTLDRNTTQEHA